MSDILSQSEIDALLNALTDDKPAATSPSAGAAEQAGSKSASRLGKEDKRVIKVYDFKRPNKFSKEQLHTVQAIHENFSRLLTTFFSARLRSVVQINVTSVEQLTYEEVVGSIPNPTILNVLTLEPLEGNIILEINPSIAFTIIDRLFGGPGEMVDKTRGLTDIELSVMEKMINGMLELYAEAWENIIQLQPKLELMESNPGFAQIVSPTEMVVMITVEIVIGDKKGLMTVCIPYLVIEPISNKLNAHFWYAGSNKKSTTEHLEILRNRIKYAKVPMSVRLGVANITVGELLNVQKGDVIQLDRRTSDALEVLVGTKPKFLGTPGFSGSKLAVKIEEVIKEGVDHDE